MRHAGKAIRRFIRTDQIVDLRRHYGRERVPDNHHTETVFQRGTRDVRFGRGLNRTGALQSAQNYQKC